MNKGYGVFVCVLGGFMIVLGELAPQLALTALVMGSVAMLLGVSIVNADQDVQP